MANVSDLRISISEMSPQEAFEMVKSIRFERRKVPEKAPRKSPTRAAKPRSENSILAALTPEQKQQLLKFGGYGILFPAPWNEARECDYTVVLEHELSQWDLTYGGYI